MSTNGWLAAGLELLDRGWSVIAVQSDKRPCAPWSEYQRRPPSPEELEAMLRQPGAAGLGVVCGPVSGIAVLDVDVKNGSKGRESLERLRQELGGLAAGRVVRTPSGGMHLYFRLPEGAAAVRTVNLARCGYQGLEWKAGSSYVVCPPTPGYVVEQDETLTDPPEGLVRLLANGQRHLVRPDEPGGRIVAGERNVRLTSLAGRLRRDGLGEAELEAALQEANRRRCDPPLDPTEVATIARSVGRYPAGPACLPAGRHGLPVGTAAQEGEAPPDGPPEDLEDRGLTRTLAEEIAREHHFAVDSGGTLYVYESSVYRPTGAAVVRRTSKRILTRWGRSPLWSRYRMDEVTAYIATDCPMLWDRPPLDVLNLATGLLDVRSREFRPHDPAWLSCVQLPVTFDPEARCPAWERFVEETFPADARDLPWEIIAWLMVPIDLQKALLLVGPGATGKSTFLAGLTAFLGHANVAAVPLHRLESDRFSVARLAGKLANVCPDLPATPLAGSSVFKTLTGGDMLLAERKYSMSFELRPFARLVFSANAFPTSPDASDAFFRRWLVLPFSNVIDPAQATPRHVLDARLADPRELSGVLNKTLAALPRVLERGLADPPSCRAAWEEFRGTTDPVTSWLDQHTVEDPAAWVTKAALLTAYNSEALRSGRPTVTANAFGRTIRRLRPQAREAQRLVGGRYAWVWTGIGLRAETDPAEEGESLESRISMLLRNRPRETVGG